MLDKRLAAGLGLIAAAVALGEVEVHTHALPDYAMGVLFYGLFLGGCVFLVAGWRSLRRGGRATPGPTLDGRPVALAVVPNAPLAALWQQRLHDEGIEAATSVTLPRVFATPVTVLVGEHDLTRARELFPELRQPELTSEA